MGVNIGIIDKELQWKKDFAYIDNRVIDIIMDQSSINKFKCLKYLDKCDNTYFNNKQRSQLQKEIEVLNSILPSEIIKALNDCMLELQALKDHYFGFIGD